MVDTEVRSSQASVVLVMRKIGQPVDDTELIKAYHRQERTGFGADYVVRQSDSGIRSRRRELVEKGVVRESGESVTLSSGRRAILWELA